LQAPSNNFSIKPPRGTHDIPPGETELWQFLEQLAARTFQSAGYREIRVPIFEDTALFKRGVGDTTDIVNKEMYTFSDKSDRSLTLRPEGTAGVVRAYLNSGLHRQPAPVKLWYHGPMFRYERAQTGRQRQFHQIGIEAFGSAGPLIDAEVLILAVQYLKQVGIANSELQINSIGDPVCRPKYREALKEFLRPKLSELCEDCQDRFERNPLRMLDCKNPECQKHYGNVPTSLDYLCEECAQHWTGLKTLLDNAGVTYSVNQRLVWGLDYYTRTVFEVVTTDPRLGAQATICAGGRYDGLVEQFGGPATPAVGWALGMERILLLLENRPQPEVFAFVVADKPETALDLATKLRNEGFSADIDFPAAGLEQRKIGKQIQQANKRNAKWVLIVGEDEAAQNKVKLKNMASSEEELLDWDAAVARLKT
jgi:histidyl-tRNA synthetase